ncbi:MAG: type III secretion system chaperone [Gammaproteobacteria bacterium]|nr:type III secretion system chaperone [Gammaproteobacteria bacterium]MDE0284159.1 type III secretion system chaperone [Gammaproteobacteria bacterium]MDE0510378.1 type III secretion system chaperone [Gammaproteobacteria bacterium]
MVADNYQQAVARLLQGLSLELADPPDKTGLHFEPDITVNLERLSAFGVEQVVLTCKVGDLTDLGTYPDVCNLIATGNFYWSRGNGCTLSVHEGSRSVYAQHAFPLALLQGGFGVTDAAVDAFKQALANLVDFVAQARETGFTT